MNDDPAHSESEIRLRDRWFNEISGLMRESIGRPEYAADLRHTEHRFTDIERDVEGLKTTHYSDIKTVSDNISTHIRDHREDESKDRAHWRQFMYAGIAPFTIGILIAIFSAWMSARGAK